MNTYYMKRSQASCVQTELIRVTVIDSTKKQIWEWVATDREIDEANKQRLLKRYPICKFQDFEELAYRTLENRRARSKQ